MGNKRLPAWTAIKPDWIAPHLTRVFAFTYDRQSGEITRSLAGNQLLALPAAAIPNFSGHWKLNAADSDDPQRLVQAQFDSPAGIVTCVQPHDLLAGDLRGTPLQQFQPPRLALRMHLTVSRVVLGPAFYRGTGKLFQQGTHIVEGERIVLPLSTDGINGDGALGASDYDDPIAEAATDPVEVLHDVEEWFAL